MIRVNLLAATTGSPRRDWFPAEQRSAMIGLGLLVVIALGIGISWWGLKRERVALDTSIAKTEVELDKLKETAKLVDHAMARKAELAERLALIDRLRATQRGPVDLLETISRSLPDGLWLIEMKQMGTAVQLEGRATSLTALTDFVERMQVSGLFQRPVDIVTTGLEQIEEASVVRFVVKAEAAVTAPPAAAPVAPVTKSSSSTPQPSTPQSGSGV